MADNKYTQMSAEVAELQKQFQAKGQEVIGKLFKLMFENNPKVQLATWHQYTPYFNDGEECEFGRGELYLCPKVIEDADPDAYDELGYDEDEGEAYEARPFDIRYYSGHESDSRLTPEEIANLTDFASAIHALDCELFKVIYGDHVNVYVTREGTRTEEYEHE